LIVLSQIIPAMYTITAVFMVEKYTIDIIPPYIWMLSSDWLIKDVFSTISEFFLLFHHRRGICPWEFRIAWYLPKLRWLGKFASPLNRYFSQITVTNRIYFYMITPNIRMLESDWLIAVIFFYKFRPCIVNLQNFYFM
jgi:hypothetical protein